MSFSSSFSLPTVRAVAQLLDEAQLSEIIIETDDESVPQRLVVRREVAIVPGQKTEPPAAPSESFENSAEDAPVATHESSRVLVVSPTVGFFHHTEKPFGVGAVVRAGQTIATVKTLGIPNNVTASVDGRVLEILAQEGEGVAFGQQLFVIEKES